MRALSVADYFRLGVVLAITLAVSTANYIVLTVYAWFPAKGLLDWVFAHVGRVRENFALRLGEAAAAAGSKYKADTPGLLAALGYGCEELTVTTEDGFLLVLHRVVPRGGEEGARRVPLLLQHGLMQDSEAWLTTGRRSLPVVLTEGGFDVFLGNNRGNKYSCKHLRLAPADTEYWNFSFDDMARLDVPAAVDGILAATRAPQLAYVGFSQGTAQMFAALAGNEALAGKVGAFGALAAAVGVRGLARSALSSLIDADENVVRLFLGSGPMLTQAMSWRGILSPARYTWLINQSLAFLFGWDMAANMTYADRMLSYAHIYSYSSVKAVLHWFQVIRARRFQMYADAGAQAAAVSPAYATTRITVPTAAFLGGRDTVVDALRSVSVLPRHAYLFFEPGYSHLDFKWARGVARPGRAFESLLAFLHAAMPAAAAAADAPALTARFGSPTPVLAHSPAALRGALAAYAAEGVAEGRLAPVPQVTAQRAAPQLSPARRAGSAARLAAGSSLADMTHFVSDFVDAFGSTPLRPPGAPATDGGDSDGSAGEGAGSGGTAARRARAATADADVDAEVRCAGGYVRDVLPFVAQWRHVQ